MSIHEHPQFKRLKFNEKKMKEEFATFTTKIGGIAELEKGDKLSMNQHGVYSLYRESSMQSIQRWWYAESRKTTLTQLNTNFLDYVRFLDMCVDATRTHPYDVTFLEICYDNIEFQRKIERGLVALRDTYEYDASKEDEYAQKICKYINVLLSTFETYQRHIIRRAYRREMNSRSTLSRHLQHDMLERTTVQGDEIEFSGSLVASYHSTSSNPSMPHTKDATQDTTVTQVTQDKKDKQETSEVDELPLSVRIRQTPNALEMLTNLYPGNSDELQQHVDAVARGEEETSSFYDSEEETDYIHRMRKRIKTKSHHEVSEGTSTNEHTYGYDDVDEEEHHKHNQYQEMSMEIEDEEDEEDKKDDEADTTTDPKNSTQSAQSHETIYVACRDGYGLKFADAFSSQISQFHKDKSNPNSANATPTPSKPDEV